jgi:hypothetical protein
LRPEGPAVDTAYFQPAGGPAGAKNSRPESLQLALQHEWNLAWIFVGQRGEKPSECLSEIAETDIHRRDGISIELLQTGAAGVNEALINRSVAAPPGARPRAF